MLANGHLMAGEHLYAEQTYTLTYVHLDLDSVHCTHISVLVTDHMMAGEHLYAEQTYTLTETVYTVQCTHIPVLFTGHLMAGEHLYAQQTYTLTSVHARQCTNIRAVCWPSDDW